MVSGSARFGNWNCRRGPSPRCYWQWLATHDCVEMIVRFIVEQCQPAPPRRIEVLCDEPLGNDRLAGVTTSGIGSCLLEEQSGG